MDLHLSGLPNEDLTARLNDFLDKIFEHQKDENNHNKQNKALGVILQQEKPLHVTKMEQG